VAKTRLTCPCGELIVGDTEGDMIVKTREHLTANHPGHDYSDDEILFLAY
jgi:hypothetical protein